MIACDLTLAEAAVWFVLAALGTLALLFLGATAYLGSLPRRARKRGR